ncbi:zinc-ribbon domain containing protein [Fimbriiglobus ruber]|uniref:zinc-ribbon domain containing protein n=1 Tax=Fimbriiglobus ruber TaxID=1908690 RepID=UPI003B845280
MNSTCEDCKQPFVFTASEQQFWYETLKFWVQSHPKQCISCRRVRRAKRSTARDEQVYRQRGGT